MRITIIGSGYVGLVSGVCFSDFGHTVTCVDKDEGKINRLNNGEVPIFEPGLNKLISDNIKGGRLFFTTHMEQAVKEAEAVFIAVGTPSRRGDGHADLSYVYAVADEVAEFIEGFTLIVTKSTVPVGTGDRIENIIRQRNPTSDFAVVSNPEFLREGAAINDFKHPDRVVVGTEDPRAVEVMKQIYRSIYLNETPMLFTNRRTSELIKYAGNAFLATKITFINEMADLCEKVGANVQEVARGIGLDGRIGKKFLNAGPGYGGSCFPKDTLAIVKTAQDNNSPLKIIEAVEQANNQRKKSMAGKIINACGGDVKGKTIAILGLAFKPNTDDMRYAPSLDIIPALQEAGAKIKAYDPESMEAASHLLQNINYTEDSYECIRQSDALVIITEWDQFRALSLDQIKISMKTPIIIDLRNIYSPAKMKQCGFEYTSIGRPN
ncbi:UDP-glucose/GDP-mannose dehydrogenase family protein [Hellea sp.]|nr:UDP-glucose/GDP-mannose dehydrogenase family protein [Hellea sp.]MDA9048104.1 UDP-glucose/GDP-mannose dehydrogenase family protein [Hellea sp.]